MLSISRLPRAAATLFASIASLLCCSAGFAQPVLITASQTINPGQATITPTAGGTAVSLATAQITVSGSSTILTINGQHSVASLTLQSSARVTHSPGFTFTADLGQGPVTVGGFWLTTSGNVTINTETTINFSGAGYAGGQGPGAGGNNNFDPCSQGGGGGYGGSGGPGTGGVAAGGTYGSFAQPTDLGSGGGNAGNAPGGRGGGAVRLIVGGTLTINGGIFANGANDNAASGGSGGSVWITAPTIVGTGQVQANGANLACYGGIGAGGGGRIAIYSCLNSLSGAVTSTAGSGTGGGAQNGTVLIDTIAGNVAAVASAFCTGDLATLSVEAGGVGTILYQWRRDGVDIVDGVQPSGAIYAGATTAELTITGVTQTEQGSYDVEVTASCASIISNAVPVDVVGASPFPCDNLDFNNDCSAFDPLDIEAFLSVYSEGPCVPAEATCNDIDFNNDGSLFDPLDIESYLSVFSEGPCL